MSQKVVETRKNFITQEAHARHGAVRLDVLLANRGVVTTRRDILLLPSYIKIPLFPWQQRDSHRIPTDRLVQK